MITQNFWMVDKDFKCISRIPMQLAKTPLANRAMTPKKYDKDSQVCIQYFL